MQEFDRILDGHNVKRGVAVDEVNHRRLGGRFATAGGTCHEHQAAGTLAVVFADGRQVQLVHRLDPERDHPVDGADGFALLKQVAAEAGQAGDLVRDIQFQVFLKPLNLLA